MALFRLPSSAPAVLEPRGDGLLLRAPQMSDFPQWAQLRERSRAYLTPWEPIWPSDDLTRSGFRRRLKRYAEDIAGDRAYPFLIFREEDGAVVGGITLANVRRGIVQAGTIGYWTGEPYAHRGYMTAALRVLLPSLFGELNLHRVEAVLLLLGQLMALRVEALLLGDQLLDMIQDVLVGHPGSPRLGM